MSALPDCMIEVITIGLAAISSSVVDDCVSGLADDRPDLFLIGPGHGRTVTFLPEYLIHDSRGNSIGTALILPPNPI